MRRKLEKLGTNGELLLMHLLGFIDDCLFFHFLIDPENANFYFWIIHSIWLEYVPTSWILGHVLMYANGTFALEANPPLKAGYYKWFLLFYIPQVLFSLFVTILLCFQGYIGGAMAGLLLFTLKIALMRSLNQAFRSFGES